MKESIIQKAILDYLEWFSKQHKIYFFRSAAGMVKTEQGRMFKTGKPGVPDISAVYKGVYFGLEIKNEKGRQSANQKKAEEEIVLAGGQYLIIRGLEDIKRVFPMGRDNGKR